MKKTTKSLLAFMLALSMTMTMVPADALAAVKSAVQTTQIAKKQTKEVHADDAEGAIKEGIFTNEEGAEVDLSSYNLTKKEAKTLTEGVLEENNASDLVKADFETDKKGKVTMMSVSMDEDLADTIEEVNEIAEEKDATTEESIDVTTKYVELQQLFEAHPEFFGRTAPYFTSKETTGRKIDALLSLTQYGYDQENDQFLTEELSMEEIAGMVQAYTNTLQLCMAYLGESFMAAKEQALGQIKEGMTREEKLLVLNDWLGNYSTFNMSSIQEMNQKEKVKEVKEDVGAVIAAAQEASEADDAGQLDPEQAKYLLLQGSLAEFVDSTVFGALVKRNCLCIGYAAAYTYLVQCAFPEIYMSEGEWKTAKELNTGDDPSYMVDFVKIFWDSQVTMLGEPQRFQNSHFFNAVKLENGNWYYIDPCYNDIYVECMGRNRVETDGNMVHSYFLVSHDTLAKQFDGNYSKLETLYADKAKDDSYEEAWFTKACGPIYNDGTNWYYVQNTSTYDFGGGNYNEGSDQLVSLPMHSEINAEPTVLIDYGDGSGKVSSGGDLVTAGAAKDEENSKIYPGLMHTCAYYDGSLYLNVDNKILKYDLGTKAITKIKEYNQVSAKKDSDNTGSGINNAFTGMTFKVTKDTGDLTVENHPLSAIAIKADGKMYASVATNYCYVTEYQKEETNYNSNYMNYKFGNQTVQKGGNNDNEEFLWSANFVDTMDLGHLTGDTHDYVPVQVSPSCTEKGYTEERCTECGLIKADSYSKNEEENATGHHYVEYKDTTYTMKDGKKVIVDAVVCTHCLKAFAYQTDSDTLIREDGVNTEHTYDITPKWDPDFHGATMTVQCPDEACQSMKLDFLTEDNVMPARDKKAEVTAKYPEGESCTAGGTVTYTATVTAGGKNYTAETTEEVQPDSAHDYVPTFVWKEGEDGGDPTCTATFSCKRGDDGPYDPEEEVTVVKDEKQSSKATCEADGQNIYQATAVYQGQNYTDNYTVVVPATGHQYGEPVFKWSDDGQYTCQAEFTCENECGNVVTKDCTVTKEVTKTAGCEENGEMTYTASVTGYDDQEYTETKKTEIPATGHRYGNPEYTWTKDDNGEYNACTAKFTCEACNKVEEKTCEVTVEEKTGSCTEDAKKIYTATTSLDGTNYSTTKEVITAEAPGHKYGQPEFTWAEDHKTCTAKFTCTVCQDKKEDPCVVEEERENESCTQSGKVTYTAKTTTMTDPDTNKPYTDIEVDEAASAAGHAYGDPSYIWAEDYTKCQAVFICKKCSGKEPDGKVTVNCNQINRQENKATYTAEGSIVYTANFTFSGKEYTTSKTVALAKLDSGAKFTQNEYRLYSTQSGQLRFVSHYPQDGFVTITSSAPEKVAVSSNGVITAGKIKGKGSNVTITATMKSGKTMQTTVKVLPAKAKLNAVKVPLQLGKSTKAVAVAQKSFAEDRVLSWTTSNKKIVSVNRKTGKMTAKKLGTAVITVTMNSGAVAKCKVKVQKGMVRTTKVTAALKRITLRKGEKFKLAPVVTPVTTSEKLICRSDNKKVAAVNAKGVIKAKKKGNVKITLQSGKKKFICKVTVK